MTRKSIGDPELALGFTPGACHGCTVFQHSRNAGASSIDTWRDVRVSFTDDHRFARLEFPANPRSIRAPDDLPRIQGYRMTGRYLWSAVVESHIP
jgi:hypothetical protein